LWLLGYDEQAIAKWREVANRIDENLGEVDCFVRVFVPLLEGEITRLVRSPEMRIKRNRFLFENLQVAGSKAF